jgi:sterol 3beta-glucosyltransferase
VVIGFGSMTGLDADAITNTVLRAVDGLPRRVVLLSGWAGLGQATLPKHVRAFGFVPHGWLFPRAACIVHHGGAGTTAAAFRAGVPQVVVWHLGDQPVWGEKVAELGVGPACISHKKLSAPWLRARIDTMLRDPQLRARATTLGELIRSEDGLGNAARELAATFGSL